MCSSFNIHKCSNNVWVYLESSCYTFNYTIVPIYWIELVRFIKRIFSTPWSSFLNLYQIGFIASLVACFSGSPPGKAAHQVVWSVCRSCGTFASERVQRPPRASQRSMNSRSRISRQMASVIGSVNFARTSAGVTVCKRSASFSSLTTFRAW